MPDPRNPNDAANIVGPFTPLGLNLAEMPPDEREKEAKGLVQGLLGFEEKQLRVIEQFARLLLIVNGGGITIGVGVVTAVITTGKSAIPLFPGFLCFIFGLVACGWAVHRYAGFMGEESGKAFQEFGRVIRDEMPSRWYILKMQHRRSTHAIKDSPPYFTWSFIFFVAGALFTVVGLTWPNWLKTIVEILKSFFT